MTVKEVILEEALDQWNTYSLDWTHTQAIFRVNGKCINRVNQPPSGPLGFVAWIDNQYAIVSQDTNFHFGTIPTQSTHWLEIELLSLASH